MMSKLDMQAPSETERGSPAGQAPPHPGDVAPPGTEGTGEDVCPECSGKGRVDGHGCEACGGTGKVIAGIAGG